MFWFLYQCFPIIVRGLQMDHRCVKGAQGGAWGSHSPHTSHIWLKEVDCYPNVLYKVYALQMSR